MSTVLASGPGISACSLPATYQGRSTPGHVAQWVSAGPTALGGDWSLKKRFPRGGCWAAGEMFLSGEHVEHWTQPLPASGEVLGG